MLEWLQDSLAIADSGIAVATAVIVGIGFSIRPLRRRWQRRPAQIQKQQAEQLDQLGRFGDFDRPLNKSVELKYTLHGYPADA